MRHVAHLEGANSTEFDSKAVHPVVALVSEWVTQEGAVEKRDNESDLGGTMRLGGQECFLVKGSLAHQLYQKDSVIERHRHRYEVNNQYVAALEKAGMVISGRSIDQQLVEMIELPNHPWFLACQFHPEFTSNPRQGHAIFTGFVQAALNVAKQRLPQAIHE